MSAGRKRRDQGATQLTRQLDRTLPASGGHRLPGATRGMPRTRWTTLTRPGLRRALWDGEELWLGQKWRSVNTATLCFCSTEALSDRSDHCRAMGYRIRGLQWSWWTSLGRSPNLGQGVSHQCEKHLGRIPPTGSGRLLSGGQPKATSVPVDYVYQARST